MESTVLRIQSRHVGTYASTNKHKHKGQTYKLIVQVDIFLLRDTNDFAGSMIVR